MKRWLSGITAGLCLTLLASLGSAEELRLEGRFVQGGLVRGATAPNATVRLDGQPVRVASDGSFIIGFGRDHGPTAELRLVHPDGREEVRSLQIEQRVYDVQRIDGLPPAMVTPDEAALERIRREAKQIAAVRELDTPEPWFLSGFVWPAHGTVSGVFGSQRILNGEPRQPHYGIDIAAPPGTPVVASTDGRVALAEPDLYYTGGTVMLDHGHGLTSVYSHLASVEVKPGQMVRQGDRIGTVGSSGRATGPHLDWRLNWFGERLDPALLVGPMLAVD